MRRALEAVDVSLRSRALPGNLGPAVARNVGLRLAHGSLIAFLDSDDVWEPQHLSTLVALLDRHQACGVAFSGNDGIDRDGDVVAHCGPKLGPAPEGELARPFERLVRSFPYVTSATLVRRSVFDAVGQFDETLASWEDADLWLRIAKRFDFAYSATPLVHYRLHPENMTNHRLEWHTHELRVWLRHRADVCDPSAERVALEQIQRAQVLLQEQLLREPVKTEEYLPLLYNDLAPRSWRYRLGRLVMHGPCWLRRLYAGAVRGAGNSVRWSQGALNGRSPAWLLSAVARLIP